MEIGGQPLRVLSGHKPPWVVGGDLNSSETFDSPRPRGNREILDRMQGLGLREGLRHAQGQLVPTLRNPRGGYVGHQMDHLFVSESLATQLVSCTTGDHARVFDASLERSSADHCRLRGHRLICLPSPASNAGHTGFLRPRKLALGYGAMWLRCVSRCSNRLAAHVHGFGQRPHWRPPRPEAIQDRAHLQPCFPRPLADRLSTSKGRDANRAPEVIRLYLANRPPDIAGFVASVRVNSIK